MRSFDHPQRAQTFIFFLIAFGAVFLLCGLGLDSGLLYLAKAKLSRAADASVISAVANFSRPKEEVARVMRNVAVQNYRDLQTIQAGVPTSPVIYREGTGTNYDYTFVSPDGNTSFTATIAVGPNSQITLARAAAKLPNRTLFMGYAGVASMTTYNIAVTAEAQRRPRLMVLVLDRSGSMLGNGGSTSLPPAVMNFVRLFDTVNDNLGIVSFSSFARVEVPITNDFKNMASNLLLGPGISNAYSQNASLTINTNGMKFGGVTDAEDGMRLGMEMLRSNTGYSNPQTTKYLVFFTDGQFNSERGLWASPSYTNTVTLPYLQTVNLDPTNFSEIVGKMPMMSTNSGLRANSGHLNPRSDLQVTNYYYYATNYWTNQPFKYFTNVNVWIPPGAVLYNIQRNQTSGVYTTNTTVSRPLHFSTNIILHPGDTNMLVMPGYLVDGVIDGALVINGNPNGGTQLWSGKSLFPDSPGSAATTDPGLSSQIRDWQLRDAQNILGDFSIYRPDDPLDYDTATGAENNRFVYPGGSLFWQHDWTGIEVSGSYPTMYQLGTNYGVNVWAGQVARWSTNFVQCNWKPGGTLFFNGNGDMASNGVGEWIRGAPPWLLRQFQKHIGTNTLPGGGELIALKNYGGFYGHTNGDVNWTGGVIEDPPGEYRSNVMSINSHPMYMYNFETSTWVPMISQTANNQVLNDANWKTLKYCQAARQDGVKIYTVGFASSDPVVLSKMANAPGVTLYPGEPQGQFYQAVSASDITTAFVAIANAIQAFVTQ